MLLIEPTMTSNEVQVQPGMSVPELFGSFITEAQCGEAVRQARCSLTFRCPRYPAAKHYVTEQGSG